MNTFTSGNTTVLPGLYVYTYIDGKLSSQVYCTGITEGIGTTGSEATFELPAWNWDYNKQSLRGAFVQVRVRYYGEEARTRFNGYITTVNSAAEGQSVSIKARSLVALSDTVYIGEDEPEDTLLEVFYPAKAYKDGILTDTGWTIPKILRDWFGSRNGVEWKGGGGSIPSQFRAKLQLGSISVLSNGWNNFPLGDLSFKQSTLKDALDTILNLAGTISFREEHADSGDTYLHFFELADSTAPRRSVRVGRPGQSAVGTNVLSIDHEEGMDDVKTRIIAVGAPRKFVVSIATDSAFPLRKGWSTSLEAAVLNDPESVKKSDSSGFDETRGNYSNARSLVFRKYYLPNQLKGVLVDSDNAVALTDDSQLELQVWKYPRNLSQDETGEWTSTLGTTPVLLEGAEFNPKDYSITLKDPAINMVSGSVDGSGNILDEYEEAVVGITLTFNGKRLFHDTGAVGNGLQLDGIKAAGLTEAVENASFGYVRYGNAGYPINGATWNSATFLAGSTWYTYTNSVAQDDSEALEYFAQAALKEKLTIKEDYSVTTPFWTDAYRLGERIEIVGEDSFNYGTHQIRSLSFNLGADHSTSFSTDTSVPLVASTILREDSNERAA